jgi:hypothetical protein
MVVGFASFGIYILGLIFGIIALTMIRRYGRRAILVPAIIGVVINGGLVLLFSAILLLIWSQR